MFCRWVPFVKGAALGAVLLLTPQARAGDRHHSPSPTITRSQPATPVVASALPAPQAVSVVVALPPQPAKKPVYVNLRGPDGQVRRFLVEGGRAAIQYRQVVLRPGQSLSIRWVSAR
jgi:hypothetical protein